MTKADKKVDTSKPNWTLSSQQEAALDLLATGHNVTAAAEAIGISRQTVSEWLNHHCGFQAALNQRQQELWRGCSDKLRALLPKALDTLEAELEGKDRLKAAESILKAAGFFGSAPQPSGSTNPDEIEKERAIIEKERKDNLAMREMLL